MQQFASAAARREGGFEPTSAMQTHRNTTSSGQIADSPTPTGARIWAISAADAPLGPTGAGFELFRGLSRGYNSAAPGGGFQGQIWAPPRNQLVLR